MSDIFAAFGTLLELDDGTGTYVTVAGLGDINPPVPEVQFADATNQMSPNHAEEKKPTIIKLGDCSFDILLDLTDPTHDWLTGLIYLRNNRIERNWRIHYTDTTTTDETFKAYVKKITPKAQMKDLLKASVDLEVTSLSTYA